MAKEWRNAIAAKTAAWGYVAIERDWPKGGKAGAWVATLDDGSKVPVNFGQNGSLNSIRGDSVLRIKPIEAS